MGQSAGTAMEKPNQDNITTREFQDVINTVVDCVD